MITHKDLCSGIARPALAPAWGPATTAVEPASISYSVSFSDSAEAVMYKTIALDHK